MDYVAKSPEDGEDIIDQETSETPIGSSSQNVSPIFVGTDSSEARKNKSQETEGGHEQKEKDPGKETLPSASYAIFSSDQKQEGDDTNKLTEDAKLNAETKTVVDLLLSKVSQLASTSIESSSLDNGKERNETLDTVIAEKQSEAEQKEKSENKTESSQSGTVIRIKRRKSESSGDVYFVSKEAECNDQFDFSPSSELKRFKSNDAASTDEDIDEEEDDEDFWFNEDDESDEYLDIPDPPPRAFRGKPPVGSLPSFGGQDIKHSGKGGKSGSGKRLGKSFDRSSQELDLSKRRVSSRRQKLWSEKLYKDYEGEDLRDLEPVWRPTDDFRLIVNVLAVNDLSLVKRGVQFSAIFSQEEIEERWKKLLYDEKTSHVSQQAIAALHPKVKQDIQAKSLFTPAESDLVATMKESRTGPSLTLFQDLLDKNVHIFNPYRTAKILRRHWYRLRELHILKDQNGHQFQKYSMELFESKMKEIGTLCEVDDAIVQELNIANKNLKKHLRRTEQELRGWQSLNGYICNARNKNMQKFHFPDYKFDKNTLAVLIGYKVTFFMHSREITLGRKTPWNDVDADLREEAPISKISRRQAIIQMRRAGKFFIINLGRHLMHVDGEPLFKGEASLLSDRSIIQLDCLNFLFIINNNMMYVAKLSKMKAKKEAQIKASQTEVKSASLSKKLSDQILKTPGPNSSAIQNSLSALQSKGYFSPEASLGLEHNISSQLLKSFINPQNPASGPSLYLTTGKEGQPSKLVLVGARNDQVKDMKQRNVTTSETFRDLRTSDLIINPSFRTPVLSGQKSADTLTAACQNLYSPKPTSTSTNPTPTPTNPKMPSTSKSPVQFVLQTTSSNPGFKSLELQNELSSSSLIFSSGSKISHLQMNYKNLDVSKDIVKTLEKTYAGGDAKLVRIVSDTEIAPTTSTSTEDLARLQSKSTGSSEKK